jgi:hypothetical protein
MGFARVFPQPKGGRGPRRFDPLLIFMSKNTRYLKKNRKMGKKKIAFFMDPFQKGRYFREELKKITHTSKPPTDLSVDPE